MSYGSAPAGQMLALGVFLGVGFLLGLLFELCRFFRKLIAGERTPAIRTQDIVFCALSFFVLFFAFLAFADGYLRLHLFCAAPAGFLAFRLTLQKHLRFVHDRAGSALDKAFSVLLRPFFAASKALRKKARDITSRFVTSFKALVSKTRKNRKKKAKNEKRPLKNPKKSV